MSVTKDINVDQGSTKVEVFNLKVLADPLQPYDSVLNPYIPFDLTDYEVRMQVRKTVDSNTVILEFQSTTLQPEFVKNNATGTLTLTIPAEVTIPLRFTGDYVEWVYDIEIYDTALDIVIRPISGMFNLSKEVTR